MAAVKTRRNVFVRTILNDTGNFEYVINIPFHVDDMIMTAWTAGIATAGEITAPFLLSLEGVGDIASLTENDFDSPRHIFNLNRPFVGVQRFTVRSATGTVVDRTGTPVIFCLEFIEYIRP